MIQEQENNMLEKNHKYLKFEQFLKILKLAVNKKVLIIIKGYPDPDSIASALAFKYLASVLYNIESTILHFDKIGYFQNHIFINKLGIELIQYSENFNFSKYDYMVFNDTQTTDLPIEIKNGPQTLVLIDHHKNLNPSGSLFTDIREDAGATCSIYAEYLSQIDSKIYKTGKRKDEFIIVATALMHGIRTDTDDFLLAKEIDYEAAKWIFHYVDKNLLVLISNYTISAKTMDMTYIALKNRDIIGSYLFAGVYFVEAKDRDSIALIADYLLRLENIETVIVYGIINQKYIEGSFRTRNNTLDPDKWIKDTFGFDLMMKPYGGGRCNKGGFKLPLGIFSECIDKKLLWKFIQKTMLDIFYKKLDSEKKLANRSASTLI